MEDVVYTRKGPYVLNLILASIGFFFIYGVLISKFEMGDKLWIYRTIMFVFLVLALATMYIAIKKLFGKQPALTFSEAGLTDHASTAFAGLIPHSEISGYQIKQYKSSKHLLISLKSNEAILAKANGKTQAAIQKQLLETGAAIVIPLEILAIKERALRQMLDMWLSPVEHLDRHLIG